MPGPSDIRVNPFNNATNYVNLTERHIVPSVSPFVVRLNEVPEKQDPSNMQMYYVDDTTGQTTETALTEVAATPGAGEFRPDYSTNAFDDTSWNTGLIEFSSADAGKIIEVSYTATGTLAGVKTNRYPAWWLDRGDGSDGDIVVSVDDKWKETQLAAACGTSETQLTVDDFTNINEGMTLQVDNEKMLVTAIREPNIVYVTRAQNETVAAGHSNDAAVYIVGKKMTTDMLSMSSLTINSGATLYTYGVPIFVNGPVNIAGKLDARGQCGVEANMGTQGRGGLPNGGLGGVANNSRLPGDNGGCAVGGGTGGNAYAGDISDGGAGGSGSVMNVYKYTGTPSSDLLALINKNVPTLFGGGGGGGAGGLYATESASGGAGGGYGVVIVAMEIKVTGKITSKGGKSSIGRAASSGRGTGVSGSGGSGGGGSVLLIANTIIQCGAQNIDVSGGELAYPEYENQSNYIKGYSGQIWKVEL